MAKIVLDSEPTGFYECPFGQSSDHCSLDGTKCCCISGYYDSRHFEFGKCAYCTTLEKLK